MTEGDLQAAYLSEHFGDEGDLPKWVLYVPSDKLHYLLKMEEALPNPEKSEEFRKQRDILKAQSSNKAINDDDLTKVSAIKGLSDSSVDATGYDLLMEKIEPAAQTLLIKGAKGTGKTTKAVDIVKKAMDDGIIEKMMTNVQLAGFKDNKFEDSEYDVRYTEIISEFLEFAKEDGEKLMLMDELSTVANLLGSSQEAQDIFPRVINALRKSKGGSTRVIAIGHQHDTDILPSLKNNADGVLEAPNKLGEGIDRAIYYESFSEYQNEEQSFKVRGLQDITDHPLFGFNDNSFATLEFNLDHPEKQIKRGKIRDDWERFQDSDETAESQLVFCAEDGCKSNSQQYPELANDDVKYCPYHQDEDGDDDDSTDEQETAKNNQFMDDSEENIDPNAGHSDEYVF